ncbi:MAG: alpha/beta fold hydrolase [Planctomycetes bacterium]|nr:alpha/beta fold hydrolase [Planctomycetota bacterium]
MSRAAFAELQNRHGERLDHAFVPAQPPSTKDGTRGALALLAHGVTSAHDRPYLIALGEALAVLGVDVLSFTFAGNGGSAGRFDDSTPSKEVLELAAVLDVAAAAGYERIGYAGHSMGGAVGLLRAAEDSRIRALVSLAGMFHVARFYARVAAKLQHGELLLGKEGCPWNRALDDDARRLGSLDDAAARVRCPWLLIHGTLDDLVPLHDSFDARAAAMAAGQQPEIIALSGVDHRFTGAVEAMVAHVAPWLAARLR